MSRAPAIVMPLLFLVAVAVAGFLTFSHPIENTFPVHRVLAQQLRSGGADTDFTPLGYPWLLSRMPVESIDRAVRFVHFGCYFALMAVCAMLLRRFGSWNRTVGLAAAAFILFNPYVLLNLYRLNDTSVAVVLTLTFFAVVLAAVEADSTTVAIGAGAILAMLIFVRPNAITLAPVLAYPVWGLRGASRRTIVNRTVAGVIAAVAMYTALSLTIARVPFFWPSNGPYNLFAGNNPAAVEVLKSEYNAETSLDEGLAWCGVDLPVRSVSGSEYIACAIKFVRSSPLAAAKVTLFKLYNLMWRPNLRLADSTSDVLAQLIMLAPSAAWTLASLVVAIRMRRTMDPFATLFVVFFSLPLVFTNTDPRFRLPLDPVFALSLASPAARATLRASFAARAVQSPTA